MNRILTCLVGFILGSMTLSAQDNGVFSGGFMTNANVFLRDSTINAINTPQYDHQLFGGESWLNMNYKKDGFTLGLRLDAFNNSNLQNPRASYSGTGIGRWYIEKDLGKVEISGGYLYDQIGTGMIFRAFETRPLFIDNALYGARVKYRFNENWNIMGMSGIQKHALSTYSGSIKLVRVEGFHTFGEESPLTLAPGFGFVNRTISDENMNIVIDNLRTYQTTDLFTPKYNSYAASLYNTLGYKNIRWYFELAAKSEDIFFDANAKKAEIVGTSLGKFEQLSGSVLYSSVSYSIGKFGGTFDFRRTENFDFRVDPNQRLNFSLINYLTPLNRQNTYRLTAYYSPAVQSISELGYSLDLNYKFNKSLKANINISDVKTIGGEQLFQEIYTEVVYKHGRQYQIIGGVTRQIYNQAIYQQKPKEEFPNVKTIIPYVDFLYKFNKKNSLRTEFQYMHTEQDFGSWVYGLAEYSIAPTWIFELSGMYNLNPLRENSLGEIKKVLYPTAGVVYLNGVNRFNLRYVKQVEGIVCSGGICRLEPAFSGVRFNMTSNF